MRRLTYDLALVSFSGICSIAPWPSIPVPSRFHHVCDLLDFGLLWHPSIAIRTFPQRQRKDRRSNIPIGVRPSFKGAPEIFPPPFFFFFFFFGAFQYVIWGIKDFDEIEAKEGGFRRFPLSKGSNLDRADDARVRLVGRWNACALINVEGCMVPASSRVRFQWRREKGRCMWIAKVL